jgi:hypothetical protein
MLLAWHSLHVVRPSWLAGKGLATPTGVGVATWAADAGWVMLIAIPNIKQTTKTREKVIQTGFLICGAGFVIFAFSSLMNSETSM